MFKMKEILNRLTNHEELTAKEAAEVLTNITQEKYNAAQIASFMTTFQMRGISVEELSGFRSALMKLCHRVDVGDMETIDVCGTGGDGKDTFNISTLSSIVIAGAGYKVVKHGNKSVSSNCGSSDVLASLGYKFTNDASTLLGQLEKTNYCYFHAPLFHPALKSVGAIRKDLGTKTFFNMLGPLVNPASPTHQLVGVFSLKLMRLYEGIFEGLGHKYSIVHGLDGFDEISLTDKTKVVTSNNGTAILEASHFGLPDYNLRDINGGTGIEDAKEIFINVLENKSTAAQRDVVLANSALAIDCFKEESDIASSIGEARESLESGKALDVLKQVTQ